MVMICQDCVSAIIHRFGKWGRCGLSTGWSLSCSDPDSDTRDIGVGGGVGDQRSLGFHVIGLKA